MKRAGGSAKLLQEQGGRMNRVEKSARGGWGVDRKVKVVMCVMRTEMQGPGQVNHIWSNWPV